MSYALGIVLAGGGNTLKLFWSQFFWAIWNERNARAFEGINDDNGFDLIRNKWL